MSQALRYEIRERVATITLARPEARNPLGPEVVGELVVMLRAADRDAEVKCVLIQAEGDNFSAGGDVKSFGAALQSTPEQRADAFERRLAVGNRLPQALVDLRKPIVTATRGAAVGAGLALVLGADIVVAGESSFFLAAHVLVGLSLDCGLSGLLVAAMGVKQAKRFALLGDRVDAREALSLGMVTRVVSDAEVANEARKFALRLAQGPGTAMAGTRALLNEAAHRHFAQQLAQESRWIAACVTTDDFRKGVESALTRQRQAFD